MGKTTETGREYLTTPEAARLSGLSKNYIATLLRRGKLEGFQLARDRFVYTDSLQSFLATNRKSGPKGPRKKTEQETASSAPASKEHKTTI